MIKKGKMAPEASGSSSSASLSQVPPVAPSRLSASDPHALTPPPVASFSSPPVPPAPLLYLQDPWTISFAELTFFFETLPTLFTSEFIRSCPFKMKPSEGQG